MSILNPNTGNERMDEAYAKMQMYVSAFADFESFYNYFLKIVKTDDKKILNKWLLKVLFIDLKYTNNALHPFDKLLTCVDENKKKELEAWLVNSLKKWEQPNDRNIK